MIIERVRVIAGPCRFGFDQFKIECDRDLAGYFVLQREQVVGVMVEPFGPYMHVPFRVDQLRVDPDALSKAPDAAFQEIAYIQFAADPANVGRLVRYTAADVREITTMSGMRDRSVVMSSVIASAR